MNVEFVCARLNCTVANIHYLEIKNINISLISINVELRKTFS
jgi:hypothetical protein